ncbi:MAG TPA: pilus assembly protein [Clostridiaceae bacterium]|nr:pilus assembly protein [Clostridiaceae bacterium]
MEKETEKNDIEATMKDNMKAVRKNSVKGSFTLEAAIIFPLVLIIIAGIFYVTYLLYIKTVIQSVVDLSVRRGIKVWDNLYKEVSTGKIQKINSDLYWDIFDINREKKEDRLKTWLKSVFDKQKLLHDIDMDINVWLRNCLLYKQLNSEVIAYYKTPISSSVKEYLEISGNSKAILNHPPDFIRNIDFIVELEIALEQKYKSFGEFMDRIRRVMEEITQQIERFGVHDE